MKKVLFITLASSILTSCAYMRIGDLNMLSNRNIDKSTDYVLLERNVIGIGKVKKDDALERAVDNATESVNGEYIMNVKVYIKNNGKKIKVEGDVWGVKGIEEPSISTVSSKTLNKYKVGDKVKAILRTKAVIEGKVVEVDDLKKAVRIDYYKDNRNHINWFAYKNVSIVVE